MPLYQFTLIVANVENFDGDLCNAVYEACGEVEFQQSAGVTWLDFTREGSSFEAAVTQAISDAIRAGLDVRRVEQTEGEGTQSLFDADEATRINSQLATVVAN